MRYILRLLLLSSIIYSQDHFNLNINETGESSLFIFQDDISTLDNGDEIGIFDSNGIIDSTGTTGEILVGAGIWNGSQLEIVGIHGVDLSQFGGPILPGADNGNPILLKVWKALEEVEYTPSFDVLSGSGTFDGLFSVIENISCLEEYEIDECGICDGPGAIYECGCSDIPEGFCDCDENVEDCAGVCNGFAYYDECGICDDIVSNDCELDCAGTWGGSAQIDECGICDGPGAIYECGCSNIPEDFCDCNENIEDCTGACGGDALVDNCGVCDGDGSACDNAEVVLSFYDLGGVILTNISYENLSGEVCLENVIMSSTGGTTLETFVGNCVTFTDNSGNFPIYMKNTQAVAGFQFNITGLTILGTSGGAAADAGFTVSTSSSVVLGFSFSGSSIGASGDFYGCLDVNACNYDSNATADDSSCEYPEEGYDCEGNCLDEDCAGECGGSSELDECGICDGPGAIYECGCYDIPEEDCDCDGNILDCEDVCGGTAELDCLEICNGNALIDECGICEGPGPEFECEDGTFACDESGCITEDCYDTDCGFYLLLGSSCEYAESYGADCSICLEQGYCDDDGGGGGGGDGECGDGEILDCFGSCVPASWLGDGWCDESMADFNCLEFAYDNGDCQIDFSNHVMPLITANCTGYCHSGAANYQGGLNLESYTGLMEGGNSGPAVQPYYPDYSLIIQKLNGTASGAQMPDDADPLPENYINTIYFWIEQGAIGSDDDGWEGGCVEDGLIEDCTGACVDENLLGDGNCDDGEEGEANFNCPELFYDYSPGVGMPDCPVGILEFGNITYAEGQGTLEILMNCEYPVSDFEIEISGITISGASGGTSEESDFSISFSDSLIQGSVSDSLIFIPSNSGLLTVLDYDNILLDQICFESSIITTYIGMSYEAVLGDCIEITSELDGENYLPTQTDINSIYPNPFNPSTTINYSVYDPGFIKINIMDIKGRKIQNPITKYHQRGTYEVVWNASNYPSGIYLIQLISEENKVTKKVILTK